MIRIPEEVWHSAETKEELEDWLLARDPKAIRQLRRIRTHEDLASRGKSLAEIASQWNIEL